MKIEIKSTSYLLPNNTSWSSLKKNNKLVFSEYNNIFSDSKFNDGIQCEILVLFLIMVLKYCNHPTQYLINLF